MKQLGLTTFFLCLLAVSSGASSAEHESSVAAAPPKTNLTSRVYESCKAALNLTSNSDFQQTYCGAFFMGYNTGFLISNWAIFTEPEEDDPCRSAKKLQIKKLQNRFTLFLGDTKIGKDIPNQSLLSLIPFMVWAETHQNEIEKFGDDLLDFSSYLYTSASTEKDVKKITRAYLTTPLAKAEGKYINEEYWPNSISGFKNVSLEEEYLQCKNDLESFSGSLCEAQIMGYLAAIHSNVPFITKETTDIRNKKTVAQCDQEILEIYQQFDTPKRQCVTRDTHAKDIAVLFLRRYEQAISRQAYEKDISDKEFESAVKKYKNLNGIGTVGYFTLYYGDLCQNKPNQFHSAAKPQ